MAKPERLFKCIDCGDKYPDSFAATKDVRYCRWCSGEEFEWLDSELNNFLQSQSSTEEEVT